LIALADKAISASPDDVECRVLRAGLYSGLAAAAFGRGDVAKAAALLKPATADRVHAISLLGENRRFHRPLALVLGLESEVAAERGDLPTALAAAQENMRLSEALLDWEAQPRRAKRAAVTAAIKLANLQDESGQAAAAKALYERALGWQAELEDQAGMAATLAAMARLAALQGDKAAAEAYGNRSKAFLPAEAAPEKPSGADLGARSYALSEQARTALAAKDYAGAAKAYEETLKIDETIAAESPDDIEAQTTVVTTRIELAGVHVAEQDFAAAEPLLTRSVADAARLLALKPDNPWTLYLSYFSLLKMGEYELARKDRAAASANFDRALTTIEELVAIAPSSVDNQVALAGLLQRSGDMRQAVGDVSGARARFEQMLARIEPMARANPANARLRSTVLVAMRRLVSIYDLPKDRDALRDVLQRAVPLAAARADSDPLSPTSLWSVAWFKTRQARLVLETGDRPGGEGLLRAAQADMARYMTLPSPSTDAELLQAEIDYRLQALDDPKAAAAAARTRIEALRKAGARVDEIDWLK
jgi:tetratricopeptide (TPR) repeat protein